MYIRGKGRGGSDAGPAITASADAEVPAPPPRGHSVKAGNAICSPKQHVRVSARHPGKTAGERARAAFPSDRFSFSSRRTARVDVRGATGSGGRGARAPSSRARGPPSPTPPPPQTFAVPPTEPRARTHTAPERRQRSRSARRTATLASHRF